MASGPECLGDRETRAMILDRSCGRFNFKGVARRTKGAELDHAIISC